MRRGYDIHREASRVHRHRTRHRWAKDPLSRTAVGVQTRVHAVPRTGDRRVRVVRQPLQAGVDRSPPGEGVMTHREQVGREIDRRVGVGGQ